MYIIVIILNIILLRTVYILGWKKCYNTTFLPLSKNIRNLHNKHIEDISAVLTEIKNIESIINKQNNINK